MENGKYTLASFPQGTLKCQNFVKRKLDSIDMGVLHVCKILAHVKTDHKSNMIFY